MAEDQKTLWVGDLDDKVTEELLYELLLQTGPIEKLILPTEGEKDQLKHKGHAYVVFKHADSVPYAVQVLEGTSLFSQVLSLKPRGLPIQYRKAVPQPTSTFSSGYRSTDRYDNSSLRGGFSFNKSNTWHGQNNSFMPRGRGGHRGRGGYNSGQNYYQNQQSNNSYSNTGATGGQNQSSSMDDRRQRVLQQQSLTIEAHRQIQQGVMNMANQMYNAQQQQQQQQWSNTNNAANYNMAAGNWVNQGSMSDQSGLSYQGYQTDQYGGWYQ